MVAEYGNTHALEALEDRRTVTGTRYGEAAASVRAQAHKQRDGTVQAAAAEQTPCFGAA